MSESLSEMVAGTYFAGAQNARIGAEKDGSKVAVNEPWSLTTPTPAIPGAKMADSQNRPLAARCRGCGGRTLKDDLCHLCRADDFDRELPPGRWVGGLVKTFIPDPVQIQPEWSPELARAAHARRARGACDDLTIAGERAYQRMRKRRGRADAPRTERTAA